MINREGRPGSSKRFEHGVRWALLLSCTACSAPYTCDAGEPGAAQSALKSNEATGANVLVTDGETLALDFSASLQGLPELWPNESAIEDGQFSVALDLHYQNEPRGGDGVTQMPRIRITFAPGYYRDGASATTSSYPTADQSVLSTNAFRTCAGNESGNDCCPFGKTSCELPFHVELQRVDGSPFPPVVVDWSANAGAAVDGCGFESLAPTLSLKVADQ